MFILRYTSCSLGIPFPIHQCHLMISYRNLGNHRFDFPLMLPRKFVDIILTFFWRPLDILLNFALFSLEDLLALFWALLNVIFEIWWISTGVLLKFFWISLNVLLDISFLFTIFMISWVSLDVRFKIYFHSFHYLLMFSWWRPLDVILHFSLCSLTSIVILLIFALCSLEDLLALSWDSLNVMFDISWHSFYFFSSWVSLQMFSLRPLNVEFH